MEIYRAALGIVFFLSRALFLCSWVVSAGRIGGMERALKELPVFLSVSAAETAMKKWRGFSLLESGFLRRALSK